MTIRSEAEAFERAEALFHAILEHPEERGPLLTRAAAEDSDLAERVAELLDTHAELDGGFLEPASAPDLSGHRIGSFTLSRVLGAGGMGVVYEAKQENPRRRVALKVLRTLPGFERDLRRFRFEAEVMARLAHPGIAQVYEAGTTEEPGGALAWFAMELVEDARGLMTFADDEGLDVTGRLRLFAELARAVQYGHTNGVLHRDLKPDNVLVDAGGRVRVIDFGVARAVGLATGQSAGDATLLTRTGDVVGTLSYMSPEQCAGDEPDIRSDVYSLGVMLYELLARVRPFDAREAGGRTPIARARETREAPPAPPSAHRSELAGDLDTIVMTALEFDRTHRYATVDALLEDLRRFQAREPILARPPGAARTALLFARRHRVVLASVGVVALALVAATLFATNAAIQAERARAQQEREAYVATIAAADGALRSHDASLAQLQLERAPERYRGWEWDYLTAASEMSRFATDWPGALALAGDVAAGRIASGATGTETLRVWDVADGRVLHTLSRDHMLVTCCALSPDGDALVVGRKNGEVMRFELSPGRRDLFGAEAWCARLTRNEVWAVAWSPTRDEVVASWLTGEVRLLDARDGSELASFAPHDGRAFSLLFSPDGERVYTGGSSTSPFVRVFDRTTGSELARGAGHESNVEDLALSPDGETLVSASMDGTVRVWDAAALEPRAVLRSHEAGVKVVAFSPDGKTFASGALDNTIRLWDTHDASELACFIGHASGIRVLGYRPDGDLISLDRNSLRMWSVGPQGMGELVGLPRGAKDLAILPDGGLLAVSRRGEVARWDASGVLVQEPVIRNRKYMRGAEVNEAYRFSLDRKRIYGVRDDGEVVVLDAATGAATSLCRLPRVSAVLGVAADESFVVVGRPNREVHIIPLDAVEARTSWPTGRAVNVAQILLETGDESLLVAYQDGVLQRRGIDGELLAESHPGGVPTALATSRSGARIVVGSSSFVKVLDRDLRELVHMRGHSGSVTDIAFSPDETRLATASNDGTVRLWEPDWGVQLLVLRGHPMHAQSLAWSADGSRLASGGGDWLPEASHVLLWDTER
ncbi:MAG: serine/threonine-protein kinase [Planctomycetota bacterium]